MNHKLRSTSGAFRISSIAVSIALVATMAACTSAGSPNVDNVAESKDPSNIHIAFIGADGSQNFTQELLNGAEAAAAEFNVDLQALAPTSLDGQAQVKMFEDAMRSAPDGIAIMSLTPDLLTRVEAKAVEQGIPVISVDVPAMSGSNITTHVGNDNFAAGEQLATEAIRQLKVRDTSHGSVVVASPIPGIPTLDLRAEGMKAKFNAELPNFEVIGPVASAPDPTGNLTAWSNLVSANSGASVLMDAGDAALASLARINRENGGKYLTGAFDLNDAGLAAIEAGYNFGAADPQHFLKGYIATRMLIEDALGTQELRDGWLVTPTALVTQENVSAVVKRQAGSNAEKLAFYKPLLESLYANPEIRQLP